MKITELQQLATQIYPPQKTTYLIYLEQSLYCVFSYQERKFVISLNLIDRVIYIYCRDKLPVPDIADIIDEVTLQERNNVHFYSVKNLTLEAACQVFAKLVRNADNYFLRLPVENKRVKTAITGPYQDTSGNTIDAPGNLDSCHFQFLGKNNSVTIHPNANLKKVFIECLGDNNTVEIGSHVSLHDHWRLGFGCTIKIGNKTTSTNPVYMTCAERSKIIIGDDCMLATNNQLRTDDSHPIYDSQTGKRINFPKDIVLGNHVWVAFGATLFGGTQLGDGSIVGAFSVVKKAFPNNCVVAGVPAKVLRTNVFWERNNLLNTDIDEGFNMTQLTNKSHAQPTHPLVIGSD